MNGEVGTGNGEQQARVTPPRDLGERTKAFALDIVRLVQGLPRDRAADVIGRQLLRAGTSVAANYRSARRARSRREFLAKLGIVEEEADESVFWLDLLTEAGVGAPPPSLSPRAEAGAIRTALVSCAVASTASSRCLYRI